MRNSAPALFGWKLWLAWVLATAGGLLLAAMPAIVGNLLAAILVRVRLAVLWEAIYVLVNPGFLLLVGLPLGAVQQLVLARALPLRRRDRWMWVLATGLGAFLSLAPVRSLDI